MNSEEITADDIKIYSKEKAFWIAKKELEERMIKTLETDIKEIPFLIDFHKEVLRAVEEKLNKVE